MRVRPPWHQAMETASPFKAQRETCQGRVFRRFQQQRNQEEALKERHPSSAVQLAEARPAATGRASVPPAARCLRGQPRARVCAVTPRRLPPAAQPAGSCQPRPRSRSLFSFGRGQRCRRLRERPPAAARVKAGCAEPRPASTGTGVAAGAGGERATSGIAVGRRQGFILFSSQ